MRLPEDHSGARSDEHLVELWLNGRPDSTKAVYRRTALKFLEWLSTKNSSIQKATVADLADWSLTIEGQPATRARIVKSLLTFAHRTGYTVFNVGRAFLGVLTPEVVNVLAPEHGRTSCDDKNVDNPGRCNRCTLLHAQAGRYIDFDWSFKIRDAGRY